MTLIGKDSAPATHKERINRKTGGRVIEWKTPREQGEKFLGKSLPVQTRVVGARTDVRERSGVDRD